MNGVVLITCHSNGDFDAVGSLAAANALFGKIYPSFEVLILWPGSVDIHIQQYMQNQFTNAMKEESMSDTRSFNLVTGINSIDTSRVKALVIVDTKYPSRLKHIQPLIDHIISNDGHVGIELYVYDHHPDTPEQDLLKRNARVFISKQVGSAATILVQQIIEFNRNNPKNQIILSRTENTWLSLGIYEDTGSFVYPNTSPEDLEAAAYLRRSGINTEMLQHFLKIQSGASKRDLTNDMTELEFKVYQQLKAGCQKYNILNREIVITEAQSPQMVSIATMITSLLDQHTTASALFGIHALQDRVFLVGRSRSVAVDVGQICRFFGGGGHPQAASAIIKDLSPAQVKDELYAHLITSLGNALTVRSIMTTPAITAYSGTTIKEALRLFIKYSLKKIPIIEENFNECSGILDKQTTQGAIDHGMDEKPVCDIMDTEFSCVKVDDPVDLAIELVLRKHQRIIPVKDNINATIGVISRSDILKVLLKDPSRFPSPDSISPTISLQSVLPKSKFYFLKKCGELGDMLSVNVYAVGRFVRDILLEIEPTSVDIVIEGEDYNFQFVDALANCKDLSVSQVVKNNDGKRSIITIDKGITAQISSARLDYYPQPVALPTIELSSLKMELYRRDFTINSLAIQLNSHFFGRLIDFFNGLEDTKLKTIRVLHNLSFIEDPIRIFRAIRLAVRLNFSLNKQAEKLMKSSLKDGILEKLPGNSLAIELQKIMNDPKCAEMMYKLAKSFNVLANIHPSLQRKYDHLIIQETHDTLQFYSLLKRTDTPTTWRVYFLSLCNFLSNEEFMQVIRRLDLEHDTICDERSVCKGVILQLKEISKKKLQDRACGGDCGLGSKMYDELRQVSLEGLLYIMTVSSVSRSKSTRNDNTPENEIRKLISHYLTHPTL